MPKSRGNKNVLNKISVMVDNMHKRVNGRMRRLRTIRKNSHSRSRTRGDGDSMFKIPISKLISTKNPRPSANKKKSPSFLIGNVERYLYRLDFEHLGRIIDGDLTDEDLSVADTFNVSIKKLQIIAENILGEKMAEEEDSDSASSFRKGKGKGKGNVERYLYRLDFEHLGRIIDGDPTDEDLRVADTFNVSIKKLQIIAENILGEKMAEHRLDDGFGDEEGEDGGRSKLPKGFGFFVNTVKKLALQNSQNEDYY
jgi:hypothetical protein